MTRRGLSANFRQSVTVLGVLLICAGCGASASSGTGTGALSQAAESRQRACFYGLAAVGEAPARARRDAERPSACHRLARFCRWSIAFSQFRTHTDPGTYTNRPSGSCPRRELDAALRLAGRIRLAGPNGTGLCGLLTAEQRGQAERVAADTHTTCGRAAVKIEDVAAVRLKAILLISSSPGPPHWFGYLIFVNPALSAHPNDPRLGLAGSNMQIVKLRDGAWAVQQLYYEF